MHGEIRTNVQALVSHVKPLLKGRSGARSVCPPLVLWPQDPWPCSTQTGQWLLSGLIQYPAGFDAAVDAFWTHEYEACSKTRHNFSWLSDLKAMGGDQARQSARILIASWVEKYGTPKKRSQSENTVFESGVVARRALALLQYYEFHGGSASEAYQALIAQIIVQEGAYLNKKLSRRLANITGTKDVFYESCALMSIALCLGDRAEWRATGETNLLQVLDVQSLPDGGHISRSPQKLVEMLKHCLDLKRLYVMANTPFPETFQGSIDRMAQAVKFFRYTDKKLAIFHATQEGDESHLDLIVHQTGQNKRIVKALPQSGFERLTQGRTTLLMDVGKPPPPPFDRQAHLAPLAFELFYGKDRIVVNCGTSPSSPDWADALRRISAHSTLTLDMRDMMDIQENGALKGQPKTIESYRTHTKGSILLEAMHDGYVPLNGMTHIRRLYVSDRGQDIRGEDSVVGDAPSKAGVQAIVRFHLHPKVRVSLVRNGESALLRLSSGVGWKFQQSGARLTLEESVYMGVSSRACTPVKTQQLVLHFDVLSHEERVKWAFQRDV